MHTKNIVKIDYDSNMLYSKLLVLLYVVRYNILKESINIILRLRQNHY